MVIASLFSLKRYDRYDQSRPNVAATAGRGVVSDFWHFWGTGAGSHLR